MPSERKWFEDDDLAVGPHTCPECGRDCYCNMLPCCWHDCDAEGRDEGGGVGEGVLRDSLYP